LFFPFFEKQEGYNSIDSVRKTLDNIIDANQNVQYIRAMWIGLMIEKLSNAFTENEEALLAGTLEKDLMGCLADDDKKLIKKINEYSIKHIYNYKSVVEIELAGYNVIGGLLKEFVHAVIYPKQSKSKKLIELVSNQFPIT